MESQEKMSTWKILGGTLGALCVGPFVAGALAVVLMAVLPVAFVALPVLVYVFVPRGRAELPTDGGVRAPLQHAHA